jgi:hypothetical protein
MRYNRAAHQMSPSPARTQAHAMCSCDAKDPPCRDQYKIRASGFRLFLFFLCWDRTERVVT